MQSSQNKRYTPQLSIERAVQQHNRLLTLGEKELLTLPYTLEQIMAIAGKPVGKPKRKKKTPK